MYARGRWHSLQALGLALRFKNFVAERLRPGIARLGRSRWSDGGRAHYVIESNVQWRPFRLATQHAQDPQNDWLGGILPYTMTYAHGPHYVLKSSFAKNNQPKIGWLFLDVPRPNPHRRRQATILARMGLVRGYTFCLHGSWHMDDLIKRARLK